MEKKRQHIIPESYQKPWCDPDTPINQTPYIWLTSKDGKIQKRKAPENAFVGNDVYTIRLPDGGRELVIEDTLAEVEGDFTRIIRQKVNSQDPLDPEERGTICIFAAAMFARVDRSARTWNDFLERLHDMTKSLEDQHNAKPNASLQTAAMLENSRPQRVGRSLQMLSEMYYKMSMAIFVASDTDRFITSDSPVVWYNPQAHKMPPFFRSPGLGQKHIEVTMPLTPAHTLFLSHDMNLTGYRNLPSKPVQELNRRSRFHCDQWFVSWQGEVREPWFDPGVPPEDRWENTPEGKRAIKERQEYEELLRRHDEQTGT